ncbi:MAG: VOC family protein [Bacteroidota bacterium]
MAGKRENFSFATITPKNCHYQKRNKMEKQKELFSHAATIISVKEVETSLSFYRDKLGFEITFTWEEPVSYAILKRGEVSIHLTSSLTPPVQGDHTALYVFVYDVEALYKDYLAREVPIDTHLDTRDYGMMDFDILDPDGYRICFGQGVDHS